MALQQTFNQDNLGNLVVAASVSTAAPSYTTGTNAAISLTLAGLLRVDGSGVTQPISASSLPLPAGAATAALQTSGNTILSTISGQLPVSIGQKTSAGSLSVVIASDQGTITVASANDYAQGAAQAGKLGPMVQGVATTAAPTYTTATLNPLSLTVAGALRVDGSATTQPISAAALPLPTGAATSALQTTGNTSLASIDSKLNTLGQKTSAASVPVVIASDQIVATSLPASTTGGITSVASSTSTGVILSANSVRKGAVIYNDGVAILYIACAGTSSSTSFTYKLQPGAAANLDFNYTGVVSGIWSAASGSARVTEFT